MDVDDSTRALWADAAASVQADQDADVRFEAQGLVVAEMADVTFAERLAAMALESDIKVAIRGQGWRRGLLVERGSDFLILRDVRAVLVPMEAIVAIEDLPRVLHEETTASRKARALRTRGSIMRTLLGQSLHVTANGVDFSGCLAWVGADHVSLDEPIAAAQAPAENSSSTTIPWRHITGVMLPPQWPQISGLR